MCKEENVKDCPSIFFKEAGLKVRVEDVRTSFPSE